MGQGLDKGEGDNGMWVWTTGTEYLLLFFNHHYHSHLFFIQPLLTMCSTAAPSLNRVHEHTERVEEGRHGREESEVVREEGEVSNVRTL